jgi:hypothetical protein
VGKKPPQSQTGGSHGLIPRTSEGLSPKEQKKYFIFLFSCWAQAAPRSSAKSFVTKNKIK